MGRNNAGYPERPHEVLRAQDAACDHKQKDQGERTPVPLDPSVATSHRSDRAKREPSKHDDLADRTNKERKLGSGPG